MGAVKRGRQGRHYLIVTGYMHSNGAYGEQCKAAGRQRRYTRL